MDRTAIYANPASLRATGFAGFGLAHHRQARGRNHATEHQPRPVPGIHQQTVPSDRADAGDLSHSNLVEETYDFTPVIDILGHAPPYRDSSLSAFLKESREVKR